MVCLFDYVGHAPLVIRTAGNGIGWDGPTYKQLMSSVLRMPPEKLAIQFGSTGNSFNSSTDIDLPCH